METTILGRVILGEFILVEGRKKDRQTKHGGQRAHAACRTRRQEAAQLDLQPRRRAIIVPGPPACDFLHQEFLGRTPGSDNSHSCTNTRANRYQRLSACSGNLPAIKEHNLAMPSFVRCRSRDTDQDVICDRSRISARRSHVPDR